MSDELYIKHFTNKKLGLDYVIDDYLSLIWTKRFYDCGDFELEIPLNQNGIDIVEFIQTKQKEYVDVFIYYKKYDDLMIIEDVNITVDYEKGNSIIITGRSILSILSRYVVLHDVDDINTPYGVLDLVLRSAVAMNARFQRTHYDKLDDSIATLTSLTNGTNYCFHLNTRDGWWRPNNTIFANTTATSTWVFKAVDEFYVDIITYNEPEIVDYTKSSFTVTVDGTAVISNTASTGGFTKTRDSNVGSYGFTLSGNTYTSTNAKVQSSTAERQIDLSFTKKTLMTFYGEVSSESGYDKLSLYINGYLAFQISGEGITRTYTQIFEVGDTPTIRMTYTKDGSVDKGTDTGKITITGAPFMETYSEFSKVVKKGSSLTIKVDFAWKQTDVLTDVAGFAFRFYTLNSDGSKNVFFGKLNDLTSFYKPRSVLTGFVEIQTNGGQQYVENIFDYNDNRYQSIIIDTYDAALPSRDLVAVQLFGENVLDTIVDICKKHEIGIDCVFNDSGALLVSYKAKKYLDGGQHYIDSLMRKVYHYNTGLVENYGFVYDPDTEYWVSNNQKIASSHARTKLYIFKYAGAVINIETYVSSEANGDILFIYASDTLELDSDPVLILTSSGNGVYKTETLSGEGFGEYWLILELIYAKNSNTTHTGEDTAKVRISFTDYGSSGPGGLMPLEDPKQLVFSEDYNNVIKSDYNYSMRNLKNLSLTTGSDIIKTGVKSDYVQYICPDADDGWTWDSTNTRWSNNNKARPGTVAKTMFRWYPVNANGMLTITAWVRGRDSSEFKMIFNGDIIVRISGNNSANDADTKNLKFPFIPNQYNELICVYENNSETTASDAAYWQWTLTDGNRGVTHDDVYEHFIINGDESYYDKSSNRYKNPRMIHSEITNIKTTVNNKPIPANKYKKLLMDSSKNVLYDYRKIDSYESELELREFYEYQKDYNVGDVVKIVNALGKEYSSLISEVTISNDNNGYKVYPTFIKEGDSDPTSGGGSSGGIW